MDEAVFLRAAADIIERGRASLQVRRDRYDWAQHARPKQLAPGEPGAASARDDWGIWFVCAGRGFGKTRSGAEWVRDEIAKARRARVAFVAPTLKVARQLMIEGPSGILEISPPGERPTWNEHKGELHWPNGAKAFVFTSEEPEGIRGWEGDGAWCEEIGAWRNAESTWNMLRMGCRVVGPCGDSPRIVVTSTPRPTALVRKLMANPRTEVTTGTTYENRDNLDPDMVDALLAEYEGTRLGEQELEGKLLGDTPGALWKMATIEGLRKAAAPTEILRLVVAIDPAVADDAERKAAEEAQRFVSETGIVVACRARCLCRNKEEQHAFVLEDVSGYLQPDEWASAAVAAYSRHHADRIVAEVNNGGALVEATLRALGGPNAARVAYRAVHASRGKQARAEPVATLYERGLVHHVGVHAKLEDQMTTWNPLLAKRSPDRMDALVWALSDLMLGPRAASLGPPGQMPRITAPRRI